VVFKPPVAALIYDWLVLNPTVFRTFHMQVRGSMDHYWVLMVLVIRNSEKSRNSVGEV
jgi:hypothetical protein